MFYFTHILCVMLAVHVLLVLYTFCVMLTASFVMLTACFDGVTQFCV